MIAIIFFVHFAQPCTLSCMTLNTDQHRVRLQAKRPTWGPKYG